MLAAVLAMSTAILYGTADFFGGVATRRNSAVVVALISHFSGAILILLLLPFVAGHPAAGPLWQGALAGLASGTALTLFYRAMAIGTMSVVAPVTSAVSAIVPVVFGLLHGERPAPFALVGVSLAIFAVTLISSADSAARTQVRKVSSVLIAIGSGGGFGLFFVLIPAASGETGVWPLLAARCSSVALIAVLAVLTLRGAKPVVRGWHLIVCAGGLDVGANVLFLLAKQEGMLSLVATLASLYPVSTLLLAYVFLGERLRGKQILGLSLALAATTLIAAM
ncbi:EamA family transporter [Nonomuraea sp. NPDC052265]|uniref:EamA family transporter n=1 Tax=Nonomuraea sp. NPDC052265 TaxID=3364374 RepID=UPI0037C52318